MICLRMNWRSCFICRNGMPQNLGTCLYLRLLYIGKLLVFFLVDFCLMKLFNYWGKNFKFQYSVFEYVLQPIEQQSNLWSPLPNQGWKPCIDSSNIPCNCLKIEVKNICLYNNVKRILDLGIKWTSERNEMGNCFFPNKLVLTSWSIAREISGVYSGISWWRIEPAKNGGEFLNH